MIKEGGVSMMRRLLNIIYYFVSLSHIKASLKL